MLLTESGSPASPAYRELLDVMACAMHRSSLPCLCEKWEFVRGRLDKCFLMDRERPSPVSLQFLPDLHTELEKSWKKPYSAHIFPFQHLSYSNVETLY